MSVFQEVLAKADLKRGYCNIPIRFPNHSCLQFRPGDSKLVYGILSRVPEISGDGVRTTVNQINFCRVCLEFGCYRLVLDASRISNHGAEHECLNVPIILSRQDEKLMTKDELQNLDHFIYWAFTYINTARTGFKEILGIGADGALKFHQINSTVKLHDESSLSSIPDDTQCIEGFLNSFYLKWSRVTSRSCLSRIIGFYVEGKLHLAGSDVMIVNSFVCIEMFISFKFESLAVAKDRDSIRVKLEKLLTYIGIDDSVPEHFSAIIEEHEGMEVKIPTVLSGIRNAILHPTPERLRELDNRNEKYQYECGRLSLWLVELLFLKFIGYEMRYADSSKYRYGLDIGQPLPWNI